MRERAGIETELTGSSSVVHSFGATPSTVGRIVRNFKMANGTPFLPTLVWR